MVDEFVRPKVTLKVTTYELVTPPDKWVAVVSHEFYGDTVELAFDILKAHMTTDAFFNASFAGKFVFNGREITLINSAVESG
jgi:hypothetical protein